MAATATVTEASVQGASTEIRLMSRYASHVIRLESPQEVISPQHGKYQVPGTGKSIVFSGYRASIPAEWWPLLEAHRERLVQRGIVGREAEWTGLPPEQSGPKIVEGAQTAGVSSINQAPRQGWDTATTKEIDGWIKQGLVHDLEHAERYEKAHLRRKMVVRSLVDAQLADPAEPAAPAAEIAVPAPEAEGGIAPSFSAPASSGDGLG